MWLLCGAFTVLEVLDVLGFQVAVHNGKVGKLCAGICHAPTPGVLLFHIGNAQCDAPTPLSHGCDNKEPAANPSAIFRATPGRREQGGNV